MRFPLSPFALAFALSSLSPQAPINMDFEQGKAGQGPEGWVLSKESHDHGFTATLVAEGVKEGTQAALLACPKDKTHPWVSGLLKQTIDATPYRGKRLRFRAWVKVQAGSPQDAAHLSFWVEGPGNRTAFVDEMTRRPIRNTEWTAWEIVGDVAPDAQKLTLGLLLKDHGQAWFDGASLEILGAAKGKKIEGPRPLAGRGLDNLVAFTRLLGYVRHFHPSDEAAAADWEALAAQGLDQVEGARDLPDLAKRLKAFFQPWAPTLQVLPPGRKPKALPKLEPGSQMTYWKHKGFGSGNPMSIYWSERVKATQETRDKGAPAPGEAFKAELLPGLNCVLPLSLGVDSQGTLPRPPKKPSTHEIPEPTAYWASANDRTTRLANVALAWNVFQHFYPYFDVVQTDWPAALRRSLSQAAQDQDAKAFHRTLRALVVELKDGHGSVQFREGGSRMALPLRLARLDDRILVSVPPKGAKDIQAGDEVLALDGQPIQEVWKEVLATTSTATPQWAEFIGLERMLWSPKAPNRSMELRGSDGRTRTVEVPVVKDYDAIPQEPRPNSFQELRPDIFYVNLNASRGPGSDLKDFQEGLPRLEKAKGIVFDVREYPDGRAMELLAHLIDKPITCAQWHIPRVLRPDRTEMTFEFSNWPVEPKAPRLKAKVAFLISGRAISYAETILGMVEHYKLGALVGGPTAGTNGNVNPFTLPGGFSLAWTGMKVLKHDGSRHHGVGIQPTVPVTPTWKGIREGRDEVLEKALEVVGQP